MNFINQACSQTLLSSTRATYYRDLFVARRCLCLRNSTFNAIGNEAHRQPVVFPFDRLLWHNMSQDKDRHLILVACEISLSHVEGASAHHYCARLPDLFPQHLCFVQRFKIWIQAADIPIAVTHKPIQRQGCTDDNVSHHTSIE